MHENMKLGRLRPTKKQRAEAPRLIDYMTAPLPAAPPTCRNSDGAAIGMWGNDEIGDCVYAMCSNARAVDAALAGLPAPPTTDDAVKAAYFDYTGGQDVGANESEVLNLAMKGLQLGGPDPWQIAIWVSVDLHDIETCKSLVALFGYLCLGVDLPVRAQTQDVWDAGVGRDAAPGSWGGHALLLSNFTEDRLGLITWGKEKLCTQDWLDEYADEGHAILTADKARQRGIDWDGLVRDLNLVARP